MQVQDVMTRNPVTCSTDAVLPEVARLMVEHDCGEIPLYVRGDGGLLVGVITDRDITCRAVAGGSAFAGRSAGEVMTSPAFSIRAEDSIESAVALMERRQLRRLPVVDVHGVCVGMLSGADVAQRVSDELAARLERSITRPPQLVRTHLREGI